MPEELQTVVVLGGGTTAAGIADACAQAGCDVIALQDTADVAGAAGAHLVIEACGEAQAPTSELLRRIDDVVGADCLIASSTATLAITDLAAALGDPGRFAGLHFFDPVADTKVVEVVPAVQTGETTVAALSAFVERLGRRPIATKDRPGFLVNRILLPYLNQALQAYDDGIATREDIDAAVQLGLGYPTGPLALLDRIGLDVHLDATRAVHEQLGDAHFAPPPVLERLVAAGHLGRKTGRGLYDHEQEGS